MWQRTVVFTLDGRLSPVLLPWHDEDELPARVAAAFEIPPDAIYSLHLLRHSPGDFEQLQLQGLLLQRVDEPRPAACLRILLVELDVTAPDEILPGSFRRTAIWLPARMTRLTTFRLLCLEDLLTLHGPACQLWHNGDEVVPQREEPLNVEDGDFLRIVIREFEQLSSPQSEACIEDDNFLLQVSKMISHRLSDGQGSGSAGGDLCPRFVRPIRVRRPLRPIDEDPHDLDHMRAIWNRPHMRALGPDNEPVMLFETWYLSSLNFPRCSFSRQVALPGSLHTWESALRQVWRDRHHPHWPLTIVLVTPTPHDPVPVARGSAHGGHLILLQHEHPEEVGVILSSYGTPSDDRFAQLVPRTLPFDRLLWTLDQEVHCRQPTLHCRAMFGHKEIWEDLPWQARNGQHLELFASVQLQDEQSLFQVHRRPRYVSERPRNRQRAVSLPEGSTQCEAFAFNAAAPAFIPNRRPVTTMHETIQDLHHLWQQHAFAWEQEPRSTCIMTWFVDHFDIQRRHCWFPKVLRLYPDYQDWMQQIRSLWRDQIVQNAPLEIHIVSPPPPGMSAEFCAHVIVVQRPLDQLCNQLGDCYRNRATRHYAQTTSCSYH